jgi:hypothetical protein
MADVTIELKVSEEIAASTDVCDTYTPANGAEVWIEEFRGNAAFTTNSAVMIVWDYNTVNEEIVWSTKGAEFFQHQLKITGADGTKKLALCCSNGEAGALVLSGFVSIRVIT